MNANTRQGYQGYRASPTTAGKGIIRERASWKAGVYKPNGTSYAIGLTDAYNPVFGAIRQGSGRISHIHDNGHKAVMYKRQTTGFNRFMWICSCGCGYKKEIG